KDFLLALDTRFGAAPIGGGERFTVPDHKALLSHFESIDLIGVEQQSSNRAQLHLKTVTKGFGHGSVTEEGTVPAVAENGEWKLDLTGMIRGITQTAMQSTSAYERVTEDIRSNTFKDRISVTIALMRARRGQAGSPGAVTK